MPLNMLQTTGLHVECQHRGHSFSTVKAEVLVFEYAYMGVKQCFY